jgi:hypothetical protein
VAVAQDHRSSHGRDVPYFAGRRSGLGSAGARTSDRDLSKVLKWLNKRPLDYFKMFYADTHCSGVCGDRCGLISRRPQCAVCVGRAIRSGEGARCIREMIAIIDRLPISG